MPYLFDEATLRERERLAAIEASLDPFSIECLERIGVGPGWRCLEIGAGGGSVARWLGRRVGYSGQVVATDLYPEQLNSIRAPNVDVRQLDARCDLAPEGEFDFAYARLVVEYVGTDL